MRLVQYGPKRQQDGQNGIGIRPSTGSFFVVERETAPSGLPEQFGAGWVESDGTLVNALLAYRFRCAALNEAANALTEANLMSVSRMVKQIAPVEWRPLIELQRFWQSAMAAGDERAKACIIDTADIAFDLPFRPNSFRDFYAFEAHVKAARRNRGLDMVPEWYDFPVFYFSNTASFRGPGVPVWAPLGSSALDFELEVAAVIGKHGVSIAAEQADSFIAGYTILNDWSARDIQREEVKVGLGPAKGKDFATSMGPWLVTPDELSDVSHTGNRGSRYNLAMRASVNGQPISEGNLADIHYTFAEMIERASADAMLYPLDVIGSGTVGTGCITEFPPGTVPWLQPGDVVRLEVDRLGMLETPVIERP